MQKLKRSNEGPQDSRSKWHLVFLCLSALALVTVGCVSDEVSDETPLTRYQRQLAREGPQARVSTAAAEPAEAEGLLVPVEPAQRVLPELSVTTDPNTGTKTVALTLEQAITRTLANSPEIRVVSYDPEIARQEVTKAAGAFDPVAFEQISWDRQDNPKNSYFEPGEADKRLFESGLRERTTMGTEWSASYAFARNWDDLFGRTFATRFEPMVIFQVKQPLLRDAGPEVNLAGLNIALLGHQVALVGFRDKAENVSADLITAYWRLVQALRIVEIQQELVQQTLQTLHKVDSRREIDATDVQLMQVRTYAKVRESDLVEARKLATDAQDALARLMADPQINTTSEVTIVPVTVPEIPPEPPELARMQDRALATAMRYNPAIQEGRLRVEIAEINVRVAKNQQMPRVDLIGSIRSTGLAETSTEAQTQLNEGQYLSWGVGLSIEIPLGNRQQDAEVMRRHWEQRKAVSILHSAADQVAVQVKERARKVHTTLQQVHIQKQAAQAAQSQLKALEESEPIREKLTPEFMLVKLQAQETYAQTRRAEISALAEFNIAAADLARTTGTVLQLHRVQEALTTVTATAPPKKEEATAPPDKQETTPPPAEENKAPQPKRSPPASSWPTGFPYSLPEKLN